MVNTPSALKSHDEIHDWVAVSGCEMQSSLDLHLEGKIEMERDKLVCVMKLKHFPTASLEAGSVCSPRDLETEEISFHERTGPETVAAGPSAERIILKKNHVQGLI